MGSPSGSPGPPQSPRKPPDRPSASGAPAIKKIGKYEIQKKIGAGGMGAVYLAVDPILKRSCALKVLPHDKAKNPTLVKRFKAEAQAAARLRHENIVTVYEANEADGFSYIALEYVEGTDVGKLVEQRGPIPLKRSLEIVRQVARALKHAHEQGIVHRDIKPGNLLLRRDGVVKLADLGLARSLDDTTDTSITRAGTTVGTVDYMSPEQARDSRAADIRSDIYSLGCTWYFMLTGEPPFPTGSMTNKLRAHAETPIPDPRSINPAVTEAVFGVIRRMAEKKPGKRYQDPSELLADLEAAILTSDIVADTILGEMTEETAENGAPRRPRSADDDRTDEGESGFVEEGAPRRARRRDDGSSGADVEDEPPRRARKRDDGGAEAAAPAFMPPPRKDKKQLEQAEKPKRSNAALFYAVLGVIGLGLVGGIISLVKEHGGNIDASQSDQMGNPFANRDAVAEAAGRTTDKARTKKGSAGAQNQAAATDEEKSETQSTESRIVSEEGAAPVTGTVGSAIDSGPGKTSISAGEGGQITTHTVTPGHSPGPGGENAAGTSPARTRADLLFLPGWAAKTPSTSGLPVLLVEPGASGEGRFSTLAEAFSKVPASGALIQLAGSGPFPLHPVELSGKTRIVIEPQGTNSSVAPLIVLLPPEDGTAANFIELSQTTLELRRVHLALDAAGLKAGADDALIATDGGDLLFSGCSISTRGTPHTPLTAIHVSGRSERSGAKSDLRVRVLFENTLVRGNSLTAVTVSTQHLDLAVRNSLIFSGAAPALRLAAPARNDADATCDVRLASATICSRNCAVELGGNPSQPVPTSISVLNSLIAAPAGSNAPALFRMDGWNQNQQKTALGKFVNWKSTDTLCAGWPTLIELSPGAIASATSASQWQAAWKDKSAGDKAQFQSEPWPPRPISDIADAKLDQFAPQSFGKQVVKTADGGWPGSVPESLHAANLALLDAVQTAAVRPEIPRGMFGFAPRETIRIDAKDDVGKVLEKKQLQNGTQIIVSGSGFRQSSPIVIQNAWVRLQFEQGDGPPLVLTPRTSDSGQKRDAFITVANGGLELVGCVFTIPAAGAQILPKWFIQVIDGDLAMWRCRLQGPVSGKSRNEGLIQWQRVTGTSPVRMFTGEYEGYAAFEACYFIGSGTLIDADLRGRALIFRNSIAVSRDDLFSLSPGAGDPRIGGVVDLHFSTFSAADQFFELRGADLGGPATLPLALFAECCVFGPPLRSGQQKPTPTFCAYSGPVLEQSQVSWWENHCGYAPEIECFLRADSEPVATQDFAKAWREHWGAEQVIEPLRGIKGVVLKGDLSGKAEERAKLEPSDFEVHTASKAATWADGKSPIGAHVAAMQLPPIRGSGTPKAKPQPARAPAGNAPTEGF